MLAMIFLLLAFVAIIFAPFCMACAETEMQIILGFFVPLVSAFVFVLLSAVVA